MVAAAATCSTKALGPAVCSQCAGQFRHRCARAWQLAEQETVSCMFCCSDCAWLHATALPEAAYAPHVLKARACNMSAVTDMAPSYCGTAKAACQCAEARACGGQGQKCCEGADANGTQCSTEPLGSLLVYNGDDVDEEFNTTTVDQGAAQSSLLMLNNHNYVRTLSALSHILQWHMLQWRVRGTDARCNRCACLCILRIPEPLTL